VEIKEVYYFSGTGNSYIIAEEIAKITNSKLISIAKAMKKNNFCADGEIIGLVFPVYYVELPIIVDRFISKLKIKSGAYIYAVATFGGGKGGTLKRINQILNDKNTKLSAFYGIQMPQNAFKKPFDNYKKCYKHASKIIHKINDNIKTKQVGIYYSSKFANALQVLLYPMLSNIVKKEVPKKIGLNESTPLEDVILNLDKLIHVIDNCNSCGICAKVCPVNNIELTDTKPIWKHSCENCLACYNFCPQEAIVFDIVSRKHRYLHPEYKVKQAIENNI